MSKKNILIIGGGASGMLAGISALEEGAKVTLIEKNNRLGKKVLVTGNGRCNLTNTNISANNYHGQNPLFTNNIFAQFDNEQTIRFFNNLGIVTKVEERGRVFPMSDQSSSVVDILTHRLKELCADIIYETRATKINSKNGIFEIITDNQKIIICDKVIIAAGGKSMPVLGADGSGHELAKSQGHSVMDTWPSLVQIKLKGDFFDDIKGVKIDGSATLLIDNKPIKTEIGEILFTHYGVSGPAILKLSREVKKQINIGKKTKLKLSLLNNFTEESLDKFLADRFKLLSKKNLKTSFLGFLQKRIIPPLLKTARIKDSEKRCAEVSAKERQQIVRTILGWEFEILDTNSFKDAQVTAGGVNTNEIDPKTLESKIIPGLYFCGEVLDIDGDSGGFNLQFAWSTGYIAGKNAAKDNKHD